MASVSAIITTYKREPEIVKNAVKSAMEQTYPCVEIIVVDDNRDDKEGCEFSKKLEELCAELSFKLIKTTDGKHGAQAARNTGIRAAVGDYVALLDDDDVWLNEKIEKQVALLEERKDAAMAFCRGLKVVIGGESKEMHGKDFFSEVDYKMLLRGDCIGTTSQALIRKSALDEVGYFDEDFPARQDYEMWVRISKKYPIVGVDEVLFHHIIDIKDEQISRNWDKCIDGHSKLYKKYKADIDADRKAKFNVIFYMAHYNMCKKEYVKLLYYYAYAFLLSPAEFFNKGLIKLGLR